MFVTPVAKKIKLRKFHQQTISSKQYKDCIKNLLIFLTSIWQCGVAMFTTAT